MDWQRLLSTHRYGQAEPDGQAAVRSAFQKDWDRVVFSSAFRRLQDKTQVHSLPESDFVRTRLTHSLEVSSVGRSLGAAAGMVLVERYPALAESASAADFGHIVAAACLAHDIGNPPFGHYGEEAVRHWFRSGRGAELLAGLAPAERRDFEMFEGNAQGFRVLTRLQNWRDHGGLRLTAATLAAFTKYPCGSTAAGAEAADAACRKFGFFAAERAYFAEIAGRLGLSEAAADRWRRHPLAFLVEAADDICYRIVDLEDGHKVGRIGFAEAEALLIDVLGEAPTRYAEVEEESQRIGYLRAKAIGKLIDSAVTLFLDEERDLTAGKPASALTERIDEARALERIAELTRLRVFHTRERTEIEITGGEVLSTLLETFALAELDDERSARGHGALSPRSAAILRLMPNRARGASRYARLLAVTDYVSGMTDSYAIAQYRLIRGLTRH